MIANYHRESEDDPLKYQIKLKLKNSLLNQSTQSNGLLNKKISIKKNNLKCNDLSQINLNIEHDELKIPKEGYMYFSTKFINIMVIIL